MLTLLTTTGCRPQAWAICEELMRRQTFAGAVHWVIVDDGEVPQPINFHRRGWMLQVVRPTPFWRPGENTQARNLLAGLDVVDSGDRLLVIEDDDYYTPDYLAAASAWLDDADLAGECWAKYYNLRTGIYRECGNLKHAGLCSTAMAGPAIEAFRKVCHTKAKFIDIELWRTFAGKKKLHRHSTNFCVGLKGLPGRAGIGSGHRLAVGAGGRSDPAGSVFAQWLGGGTVHYQHLRGRSNG